MIFKRWLPILGLLTALCLLPFTARADTESALRALAWQLGPLDAQVGDKASIRIPDGYVFLGADDTKKFLELNQNPANGNEYLVAPKSLAWFAIFEFDAVGYVKDDETLDADAVLESARRGTEASNKARRERGWTTLTLVGWRIKPQYDRGARLLEWAFLDRDDASQHEVINYNTRLLGRTGVMQLVLVADPKDLDAAVSMLKKVLGGYAFVAGERYEEFKSGDRVAEFGLAALVAGGAAAVAAKKGFFGVALAFLAATWKLVVGALVALGAWLRSKFRNKSG